MLGTLARLLAISCLAFAALSPASAQDKFIFGTNWLPDAERGGFYQAEAAGIYKRNGLEVTVQAGGPQLNNPQLLAAGKIDGVMVGSAIEALNYAKEGVPVVAVAAVYQKNPQVLIAHKSSGIKSLEDMKGKPIMISALARNGYWKWLKSKYGYTDDQIRPYTFNLGVFVSNPQAIQQGFITYEPSQVAKAGVDPVFFLLADHGFDDFGGLILVRRETLETRRDVVRRFILSVSEGWRDFLYGDAGPGIALIKSQNQQLTDEIIANSMKEMRDRELMVGGEGKTGIGYMTEARWSKLYETMSAAGIVESGDYWKKAFDTSLLGSGLAVAPK
jgi:NitT/TauT family transport system substrate-binding protein